MMMMMMIHHRLTKSIMQLIPVKSVTVNLKEAGGRRCVGLKWYVNLQNRVKFWPNPSICRYFCLNSYSPLVITAVLASKVRVQALQLFTN